MITAQSIKHDNCFSRNFFAKISRFGRFKKYVIKIVDIFNIRNTFKVSIKILMNVVLDNGEKIRIWNFEVRFDILALLTIISFFCFQLCRGEKGSK